VVSLSLQDDTVLPYVVSLEEKKQSELCGL
jgi:hypothetical protein